MCDWSIAINADLLIIAELVLMSINADLLIIAELVLMWQELESYECLNKLKLLLIKYMS